MLRLSGPEAPSAIIQTLCLPTGLAAVLGSPLTLTLTLPLSPQGSGSSALGTLLGVSPSGSALPHPYNKLSPPPCPGAVMPFPLYSFSPFSKEKSGGIGSVHACNNLHASSQEAFQKTGASQRSSSEDLPPASKASHRHPPIPN